MTIKGIAGKALALCLLAVGICNLSYAQTRTLTGKITDVTGEPLAGASVLVEGTSNGAGADADGNYSITAKEGDVLCFSFIGFTDKKIRLANQSVLNVMLNEDNFSLEETVVIAYGTLEKKQVTSSITSLKADDLTAGLGGSTIATALVGKIPGLTISGTSSPNSENNFQLRGVASVNADKSPLVVIDGIPGGDFRALNTEDIESIDVLKDASAGAIYGTRAAGGVILVTTKKAREGRVSASYTGEFSTEVIKRRPDMLTSDEYIEYGLGTDYGSDTNWYNALLNEYAFSHRHHLSVSGGTKAARVYASFTASDQKGIVIGDSRTDLSGRINAHFSMFDDRVEIKANAEYRNAKRDRRNSAGTFNTALMLNPTIPLMNPDNELLYNVSGAGFGGSDFNPVADIELRENIGRDQWLLADAQLKVRIWDGLSATATVGLDKRMYYQYKYVSAEHKESIDNARNGSAYHGYDAQDRYNVEAYLSYDKMFGDHSVNAVAGYSFYQHNGREKFNATNYDFTVDGIGPWDLGSGTWLNEGKAEMESNKAPRERLLSIFARVNYSYASRYMVQASYRREGSSKFGPNHRWGNFWAVSAGWRISAESFLKDVEWLSDLKVRAGYGVTGNNGFDTGYSTRQYKSYATWPAPGYGYLPTYGTAKNINPDLKWEEKGEVNVGLDFAFFGNRLWGKFDWYNRKVKDLLYEVNVPQPPYIYSTMMKNIGTLRNIGYEFEIGGDLVRAKDFTWSTALRFSNNRSTITDMGADFILDQVKFPSPGNPGYAVRLTNGSEIGQFFVYKYAGLTDDGKWLIYNKDNEVVPAKDGSVNNLVEENKHYVGNAIPKAILAWDHNFRWKSLDLSIYLRSWLDFDVYNQMEMYYGLQRQDGYNVLRTAYTKNKDIKDEKILCDYFIEDGSFLKIDAINLGYTLPLQKYNIYLSKLRIYLTVRDVATFTKYSGMDPEVNINGLNPGFEYIKNDSSSLYPRTCRFTLGVQLTF
ncbi:MAG: SusC/RagA family TonB-linked outer membrane protein [Candidatus Cryptobacteroides sp.]